MHYVISHNNFVNNQAYRILNYDIKPIEKLINESFEQSIYIIEIIKKNKMFKVLYHKKYIEEYAPIYGHVQVLKWLVKNDFVYNPLKIFNTAIVHNQIIILEFFVELKYVIYYSKCSIYSVCYNGHVEILQWIKKNNKLTYDYEDVVCAYENKKYKVVMWFIAHTKSKQVLIKLFNNYFKFYHSDDYELQKHSELLNFIKKVKYKTKNKYWKGYKKN